jgi:hypothetical protein
MTTATPSEVQAARAFLRTYASANSVDIPPREFANAAKEAGVGHKELFRTICQMYAGGTLGKPITSAMVR